MMARIEPLTAKCFGVLVSLPRTGEWPRESIGLAGLYTAVRETARIDDLVGRSLFRLPALLGIFSQANSSC
jgi:hypothetical protein